MKITCRICRTQHGEFFTLDSVVPIHGKKEHKILDIYNKCFQLNAFLRDALPQIVCLGCFEKLKEFFEFRLEAQKSDIELRKNLPKSVAKEEENEFIDKDTQYIHASSSDKVTKTEDITTEDEFEEIEDNYQTEDGTNDEEIEDTDILFELYNKNDSCMEKYLKPEESESEKSFEKKNYKEDNEVTLDLTENTLHLHSYDKTDESIVTPIEIARIPLPDAQLNTIMLEPLVEVRKWQCSECSRKYLTEEKLEQHRKLHMKSENCNCEICGSHLKSLYDYGVHMKTHGTERKFSCEFCGKTFSTRANLKAHLYVHSNLRPFKCEICGKAFQQKSILKTHMTLHTGKPFECTLCHRRFSRTAHLNVHMRQHNNIRPYQCTQCPNSYMQKSHLDRHISSSHLGVRFQCTVCGKMYTKKPSLNTHMREAHCKTVSLYNCEICDLDFSKQKGLYYHLRSKHPDYKSN